MYRLTDDQVDFIMDDMKANGIVFEDLRHNLLDHICCIIETEMSESDDFYAFYRSVLPRFFQKELREIQDETENLLTFKNYYAMKRVLKISGLLSSVLTIVGALFKTFHLPGAGIMLVVGAGLFCFIFLPLLIALKFKDEDKKVDKWVFGFGFLLAMLISTGVLFKFMHWPFANIMMLSGLFAFLFVYVPLYFFTRIRRPELAFNTIVNSVLMLSCGGLMFSLMNIHGRNVSCSNNVYYDVLVEVKDDILEKNKEKLKGDENDTLKRINDMSQQLIQYIDSSKNHVLLKIEGLNEEQIEDFKLEDLIHPEQTKFVKIGYVSVNGHFSLQTLKTKISTYNEELSRFYPAKKHLVIDMQQINFEEASISELIQGFALIQLQIAVNYSRVL
jgi:hypothetical protein